MKAVLVMRLIYSALAIELSNRILMNGTGIYIDLGDGSRAKISAEQIK